MVWIILAILFSGAVVVLLVYGAIVRGHPTLEHGFLDKLKLRPDWVPLTLVVSTEFAQAEERLIGIVKEAAKWWEEQTGVRYFVPPGEVGARGHVIPIMGAPIDSLHDPNHSLAYVQPMVDKEGFLATAAVYLQPGWDFEDDEVLLIAMRHELGHCLGLAHDEYEESIMFKTAKKRQTHVSQHDKDLLLETYKLS
jgi:hypothetical protein